MSLLKMKIVNVLKVIKCYIWMPILYSKKREGNISNEKKKKNLKKSQGFLLDCLIYIFYWKVTWNSY